MVAVHLKNVTKRYGQQIAVDALSLTVPDRCFLSLVGPSGCGKTTTLRMIAGLERSHEGEIWFGEERVDHLAANHRDITMVFQSYALYPHMDVRANMSFPLRMMGEDRNRITERVDAAARRLGLDALLDRRPRELSGGQRQRVAIGRAMVRDAAIFLMDEPLSNLDAQLRVEMRTQIRRLHIELARTFIYVTHDQAEALTMSDLVAVISDGRLQQLAPPTEVYNHPANLMVAGFIGSPRMNFFSGTVAQGDGDIPRFVDAQSEISLPLPAHAAALRPGQKLIVGARPETIAVLPPVGEAPDGRRALHGKVFVVEPLGSDIYLTISCGDRLIRARTSETRTFCVGEPLQVRFDEKRLHAFDVETERAILPMSGAASPTSALR
jgi:multiple sugar transport system ATP-binding protein